tara:strand:+ start:733 stop:2286 length:1554 start_codon:yes stop_codon:yes gene_type:complete
MEGTLRYRILIPFMVILVQILIVHNTSEPDTLDVKNPEMQSDTPSSNSTNFTSSGGSGLVISGEPAYVGDTLTASLMVTNNGNSSGSVSLQIRHSDGEQIFQGEYISISPGSTREVPTSFILELPGTNEFNWQLSVLGQTGHTNLGGNLSIQVSNSQILNLTTDSIFWSASEGLEIDVSVFLSEGKARPILVAVSSEVAGGNENLQEILLEANPGRRVIEFSLGNPKTTEITIQAIPVQWSSSIFSQNITTESVAAPYIDPSSIKLEAIFNPEKPSPGSRVLVTVTLSNEDNHNTQSGTLRLISSSERTILAESTVPSLMPGSVMITEMSISEWIERDNVDVEVQWSSDGVISARIYSIEPNIDDQGLELPFDILAAGYGILAGILIILVGTFSWRAVSSRTPTTSNLRLREAKESQSSQLRIEKREIECSFCDQRLMVPNDHVGGVRCPSCSMEFMVGGPSESKEEAEKLNVVKSSDDILHCPTCDQALRVQIENRPVMSRCPVCKTQFMAEAEEV